MYSPESEAVSRKIICSYGKKLSTSTHKVISFLFSLLNCNFGTFNTKVIDFHYIHSAKNIGCEKSNRAQINRSRQADQRGSGSMAGTMAQWL